MKKLLLFFVLMLSFNLLQAQAVPRDMVVLEISTGTWCPYCPGASMGADDLIANGCRVAVIENHNGDAYDNTYSNARNSYYNVNNYPTAKFDGVQTIVGGSHSVSSYPSFLPKYNLRKAIPSQVTIEYTMIQTGRHFDFVFTITKVATLPNNILAFQFTVTQSEIMVNWQGQNHCNYVDRRMVPNQNGTSLDFTSTDVKTVNIGCDIDPLWPMEDIEFVAFVQNNTGKEILQGIRPVLVDFESTTPTTFCQSENAAFESKSMGRPASLLWLFPGGTPASSTADAPIVTYNTPGVYDVKMIATTGLTNDTVLKTGYITVNPCAVLTTPTGPIVVCTNYPGTTYSYTTEGLADTYTWELNPASGAGTLSPDGATCIVNWTPNWTGIASIRVRGTNIYGLGPWSGYLDVTCSVATANAGADGAECKGNAFTITGASATNFAALQWASNGDGLFSDPTALMPVYTPGAADILAGMVNLVLSATTGNECPTVSDSANLIIRALPEVQLPHDTAICSNHILVINGTTLGAASYIWSPGAQTSASITVDSTGVGIGSRTYTLAVTDEFGCTASKSIMVTFEDCAGIGEKVGQVSFKLYPNPSDGRFSIDLQSLTKENVSIQIVNTANESVYMDSRIAVNGSFRKQFDLSNLAPGAYILVIRNREASISQKLVIK